MTSSNLDRIRAKNARITEAHAAGNPAAPASAPVRTSPVRVTVDLLPATHSALVQWCATSAQTLGRARVTNQAVLSRLVDRLLTDPDLAEQVRAELQ